MLRRQKVGAPNAGHGDGGLGNGPIRKPDIKKIRQDVPDVQRPNRDEAEEFLSLLDPEAESFTFQTFADDKGKGGSLAWVIHGPLAEHWQTLVNLNNSGAGIFVTVNQTDGKGRAATNVVRVRAYFVDLDGAPLPPVLEDERKPHIVVESSPGRFHAYWRTSDGSRDDFKARQLGLAHQFEGDTSVHDLSRVLRLPGFIHCKGEPFRSRIIRSWDGPHYLADSFPPYQEPKKDRPQTPARGTGTAENDHQPITEDMIGAALAAIPNGPGIDRYDWLRIGMAVWMATDASDWGFDQFDDWSATWTGKDGSSYNEAATRATWDSYASSPPREVKPATLLWYADRDTPSWRRDYDIERARRSEQRRVNAEIGEEVVEPHLPTIMTIPEMERRLVHIGGSGAVADRATGRIRKKEHAQAEYAASLYVPKEPEPEEDEEEGEAKKKGRGRPRGKVKPIPCLVAWIKSANRLSVDALAWVPGEGEFCRIPENFDGHETGFNLWRGLTPLPYPADWAERAQPFLDHVTYLVPIESERRRFIQWLAHIVQCPEVLPHTCYLMITRSTGIGRNLLASILVRVLSGHVAAGVSLTDLLAGGFNGRLGHKVLATVDEAQEGPSSQRYQREGMMKSLVTEEVRRINPKYGIQTIEKNCLRWLMFSNHLDALPLSSEDRRVIVIKNPTVCREPAYYTRLYEMTNGDPLFIGSVWRYLETLDLSDFNPGERAPMNAAKAQALAAMKSEGDTAIEDLKNSCFDANGDCIRPLVSRRDIVAAVAKSLTSAEDKINSTAINHMINDSGMVASGRRVTDKWGTRHSIVIVDEKVWSPEMVKKASPEVLLELIGWGPNRPGGRGMERF